MRYPVGVFLTVQFLVAQCAPAAPWADQVSRGITLYENGRYRESVAAYEAAIPLAGAPLHCAVTSYRLALSYQKLAEFGAAEQRYKEALTVFRALGDSPRLALTLAGLGETYRSQNRLDEALANERHALRILKGLGMTGTPEAAGVLAITGEVLYSQHHLKAARDYTDQAMRIREKTSGPGDPDFATSLNNLAIIVSAQKRGAEAEALLRRALDVLETRFGVEHPLTGYTLLSLSSVYLGEKRYSEAEETCRQSIGVMRRFLPGGHPDLIDAELGLALIVRRAGNTPEAVRVLEEAVRGAGVLTSEDVRLLKVYSQYLGEAGESEKSREVRAEARRLEEKAPRVPAGGYTVAVGELEAAKAYQASATSRRADNP